MNNQKTPKVSIVYDKRIEWIRKKLESSLMTGANDARIKVDEFKKEVLKSSPNFVFSSEIDDDNFENCLERNTKECFDKLINFLDDQNDAPAVLFWVDTFKQEFEILENNEQQDKSVEKKISKSELSIQNSQKSDNIDVLKASKLFHLERYRLNMTLNGLPENIGDVNVVYFLRNMKGKIQLSVDGGDF